MQLERVADEIDRWVMPEASMNAYVIASDGEALVVDPGTRPSRAKLFREAIEARGDRVIGTVVTHPHWDHFLALASFEGVPSYAHAEAVEHIMAHPTEHLAAGLAYGGEGDDDDELGSLRIVAPSVPVEEPYTMFVGTQRVTFEPHPTAHTQGDLVVHVAGSATIAGDLVEVGDDPQWDDSSDLDGWMQALDAIEERGESILLPGHGAPTDRSRLEHHRELFVASGATPTD
ncbi:MAG TPA: MBL fold metallo-hydrolase [Candidatus Agrococcus pullicola]|uniref:MBL fold metallo-hydrolase n=1 Tax=Candidatus Agrococcus pullicola TaxID=2838429 RepID=A0A9D1YXD2_9MICO|nr:MBL fold metallo-hydrolase [Candidatus Agrococcus pullicola]